jgi:methionyl-tRNA formyltransferase
MNRQYKVIGFLAREHGLSGFNYLIASDRYDPICIFTHQLKPKSQDFSQTQREDFADYKSVCANHNVPLHTIDKKKEALEISDILTEYGEFDFIVSISWRKLIPANQVSMAEVGAVNIHRGKLPDYPGAEPIKQALNNKDHYIYVTSHVLAEKIDSGETIAVYRHPANYDNNYSLDQNIERLKKELTPYFGMLLIESLDIMADRYEKN